MNGKTASLKLDRVELAALKPHPKNPRRLPEPGSVEWEALRKSLTTDYFDPIIVNSGVSHPELKDVLVSGHLRVKVLIADGYTHADAVIKDYCEARHVQVMLAANNQIGEWNESMLADLLKDIPEVDLDLTGFDGAEVDKLITVWNPNPEPPDPQFNQAEKLLRKWKVKRGQLWTIGAHRLLCGDSTSAEDVGRLLGGDRPLLAVTDPPYGVEYDANWRHEVDRANGKPYGASAVGKVANDDRADWSATWRLFPGDVIYSWHPAGATSLRHAASLESSGFTIRMQIIWAKSHFPIGRGNYHVQHEPCWYAVRKGKTAHWVGDHSQTTLWQIDKPQKSETGHSTQKPIECMARPIRNNSRHGDLVYEPFAGSWTTICACEQLNRKCRAIEIEPKYCAMILERLSEMGLKPFLA